MMMVLDVIHDKLRNDGGQDTSYDCQLVVDLYPIHLIMCAMGKSKARLRY